MGPDRPLARLSALVALTGVSVLLAGAVPQHGQPVGQEATAQEPTDTVTFSGDVLPIFQQRCNECHGAEDENGEVRLEASLSLLTYEGVMAGSEFGSVVEPGDAEGSYLLELVVEGDMPEEGDPVPEAEIETIRGWILAGAPNN